MLNKVRPVEESFHFLHISWTWIISSSLWTVSNISGRSLTTAMTDRQDGIEDD